MTVPTFGSRFRRKRGRLARFRSRARAVVHNWGSTEKDRELSFPCDRYVREPHAHYFRAIDIEAPAEVVYRWLCQLQMAPYSYDWIDNYCRRSPRRWIPGADQIKVGQRWFIKIFELVDFEPGRQITLHIARARWFWGPDVGCTYMLVPYDSNSCRLVSKVVTWAKPGPVGDARRETYPWAELVMMRRQFLNFKRLSEAHVRAGGAVPVYGASTRVEPSSNGISPAATAEPSLPAG